MSEGTPALAASPLKDRRACKRLRIVISTLKYENCCLSTAAESDALPIEQSPVYHLAAFCLGGGTLRGEVVESAAFDKQRANGLEVGCRYREAAKGGEERGDCQILLD